VNLLLVRHAYLPDVVLGRLTVGALVLCTLEEPWIPNPKGLGGARRGDGKESCVPDGEYVLKPHDGTTFKKVWRLSNPDLGVYDFPSDIPVGQTTWGRASVLIHSGNTTDDILGCVLVGLRHGEIKKPEVLTSMAAVFESRRALDQLRETLGHDQLHFLTIEPTKGTA
jgi:hypothetical protein